MEEEKKRQLQFVAIAALFVLGMVVVILTCASMNVLWPAALILFVPAAFMPNVLVSFLGGGPFAAGPTQGSQETAKFVTGMLVTSVFVFPFFLAHIEYMQLQAAAYSCLGAAIMFTALLIFQVYFNPVDPVYA